MKEERVYRVADTYKNEAVPALIKKFGYKNVNEVPKLVKIVVNAGFGDIKDNSKSSHRRQGYAPRCEDV